MGGRYNAIMDGVCGLARQNKKKKKKKNEKEYFFDELVFLLSG